MSRLRRYWPYIAIIVVGSIMAVSAAVLIALAKGWLLWPIASTPYTRAGLAAGVALIGLGMAGLLRLARPRRPRPTLVPEPRAARRAGARPEGETTVRFQAASAPVRRWQCARTAPLPRVPAAAGWHAAGQVPGGSGDLTGPTEVFPSVARGTDGDAGSAAHLPAADTVILARVPAPPVRHLGATPAAAALAVRGRAGGGVEGWPAAGTQRLPQVDGPRRGRAEGRDETTNR